MARTKQLRKGLKGLKGKGKRSRRSTMKQSIRGGGKATPLNKRAAVKGQIEALNATIATVVGNIQDNKDLKRKYEHMSVSALEELLQDIDSEDAQQTDVNDVLIRLIIKQKKLIYDIARQRPY